MELLGESLRAGRQTDSNSNKIRTVSFYGLQSIFRYILLFDLKEALGRQDKEVIKNMDPGARLHGVSY